MKKIFLLLLFVGSVGFADTNATKRVDTNETNITKEDLVKKQIEEQMKREEKYAKEQKFYQGSEYDLSQAQVNEKSLSSIPVIEPDYDFDMDDTYSDEQ
jgi:hypothetical protein